MRRRRMVYPLCCHPEKVRREVFLNAGLRIGHAGKRRCRLLPLNPAGDEPLGRAGRRFPVDRGTGEETANLSNQFHFLSRSLMTETIS